MTVEEMMKPRYKVMADYPHSQWTVGEILDRNWGWDGDDETGFRNSISQYPNIFFQLKWWEHRNVEDMPKYVKWTDPSTKEVSFFNVSKLLYNSVGSPVADVTVGYLFVFDLLPATKDDYDSKQLLGLI